jgi:hypothetical protein
MADYQFNTNLGPNVQQGTNLADMINTARGIQAYQQSQEINPLAIQKAQMEIQQAKQVNPLEVQAKQMAIEQAGKINPLAVKKAAAETGTSELNLSATQTAALYGLAGGILNDPRIQKGDKKEVMSALKEAEQRTSTFGIPKELVNGVFGPLYAQAEKGHGTIKQVIGNIVQSGLGATGQQALQTPQLVNGPAGAPATYQSGSGTIREVGINSQQPQVGQPQIVQPQGVTSTQMGLQYPVRKAGDVRPVLPNEVADAERGAKYRNDLTTRQTDLSKSRRNLDEVIDAAGKIEREDLFSTGVLGAATRSIKGALGDEKYKQLSKDLANVQISNMQAMGGSMETDAGKQLMRMASGDETYPPEVLKKIARRTYADLTNLDMQATAASKFAKKYGDSNLNSFKQQWSQNADSKVFEAMSVFENVKDPVKRKTEIDRLLGNNPQERQQFYQKYNNIKKLTDTGEL